MKIVLRLLSWAYALVTGSRNALFDSKILLTYHSKLPVVSVGNISAGGNGKTPLVLYLVQELSRRGFKPVILSRGYGGSSRGPLLVTTNHQAREVGDEPLLLARKGAAPVVIARKRVAGAKFIEKEGFGDVIILDDGFQHRWLGRDLDIVTVNCDSAEAREEFLAGKLLPLGKFRERRDAALRRVQICVFASRKPAERSVEDEAVLFRALPAGVQIYRSSFESQGIFSIRSGQKLAPCSVVALCGIANPEGFFQTLRASGFTVQAQKVFADHYEFKSQDMALLAAQFPGLPIVCTEKDSVRLPPEGRDALFELRIALKVTPGDAFITNISRVLLQRKQQSRGDVFELKSPGSDKSLIN